MQVVDDVVGTHDRVSTTYKELAQDARPGDRLLVDDGKVGLTVTSVDGNDVVCEVTEGGPVSNNKGVSLPGMNVSVPALSEKDIEDLRWALRTGVDYIALSFVRSADDITRVHEIMDEVGVRLPVIAKIEKPQAVDALEEIVDAFDVDDLLVGQAFRFFGQQAMNREIRGLYSVTKAKAFPQNVELAFEMPNISRDMIVVIQALVILFTALNPTFFSLRNFARIAIAAAPSRIDTGGGPTVIRREASSPRASIAATKPRRRSAPRVSNELSPPTKAIRR